jgi:multiple sugar transport system permease protein
VAQCGVGEDIRLRSSAATVLTLIQVCIVFALIQRFLAQGLTVGAVKG